MPRLHGLGPAVTGNGPEERRKNYANGAEYDGIDRELQREYVEASRTGEYASRAGRSRA